MTNTITDEDRAIRPDGTPVPEADLLVRHEYQIEVTLDVTDAEHLGYFSVSLRAEDIGHRVGDTIEWTTIGRVIEAGAGSFHAVDDDDLPRGVDPSVRSVDASAAEITYSTVVDPSSKRTTTNG